MTNLRTERAEEVRHVEFRATDGADGQTLEGYAAVFNAWTDITDRSGTYREQIVPGAFKRSIGQRTPVLQFDHGSHPLIGSLPLGSISVLREDRNGLFVKARLSDNWLIEPVRDAIRDGGISGMSFRFRVIKETWGIDDKGDTRKIEEAEVLELGPVVFPAYEQTSVAVRSLVGALDPETRDALKRELVSARFDDLMSSDVSALLRQALTEKFPPTDEQYLYVCDHTDNTVIFMMDGYDEPGTFRLAYKINDGTVTLEGDPVPVVAQTTYVDAERNSTSPVAGELAKADASPDEPPVVSHEHTRNRIAQALQRVGRQPPEGATDVSQ